MRSMGDYIFVHFGSEFDLAEARAKMLSSYQRIQPLWGLMLSA